jgi:hypothetical protein
MTNLIVANMDIIEVRCADEELSWDEVSKQAPTCSGWVIFPFSNYAIVPGHIIYGKGDGEKRWISLVRNQKYTVEESELLFVKELRGDLYLIHFPELAPKRNIMSHFADAVQDFGRFNHVIPHMYDSGFDQVTAWSWDNEMSTVVVNEEYGSFTTDLRFMGVPNERGMCGTVYTHTATGRVVAIHMGGCPSKEIALAVSVLKKDLAEYDPRIEIVDPIPIGLSEAQGLSGVQVLGSVPRNMGSFIPDKTALRLSKFDYSDAPVPETRDGPAHLKKFKRGEDEISPLRVAIEKFSRQERVPSPKPPKKVSDFLPKRMDPSRVKVLTMEQAIYGIPGVLKSVDFTTSAGYFYKKKGLTRRILCFDENGEQRIHPDLRRDVLTRIVAASRSEIIPVVFEETLKDEIRSFEKNEKGETRLFSAGDFASFVAQRMYLGMFFVEMTADPVYSPTGLSINPHSKEWGLLYSRLKGTLEEERVPRAGDFSGYDISLKNFCKEQFKRLLEPFYDKSAFIITWFLIEGNFAGWHVIGVLVFVRPWGTCSGSFITSMFNTFSNWLVHKVAFCYKFDEEEWIVVQTTFTGDDSLLSVPKKYEEFDMKYLEIFLKKYFAMVYTSPTKTSDMSMTWEQVTYLKREFKVGHFGIMAPLAERSLANMIKWTDVDQDFTVMQSIVNSVLQEAWHYGKDYYNQWRDWCRKEARRTGMNFDVPTFGDMSFLREENYAI